MIVGVSDETEQKLTDYIDAKGVQFGIIRAQGGLQLYGGRGYPTFVTIGPDGDVVQAGMAGEQLIEEQLKNVQLMPDMPDSATFSGIRKAWEKRDFERVDRELTRKLEQEDEGSEDHVTLTELRKTFDSMLASAEKRIARLAEGPDFYRAEKQLKVLAKEFDGLAPGDAAEEVLDRFGDDDDVKKEIKAGETLERTLNKYDASRIAQRKKLLKALGSFRERFRGTYAAERASEIAVQLAAR